MNLCNPFQSEDPRIVNGIYYAVFAVSPNARVPLFIVDRIVKPLTNAAQTLADQQFED
jgi:hypothetical protein